MVRRTEFTIPVQGSGESVNVKVDLEKAWDGESCLGAIEAVGNFDRGNFLQNWLKVWDLGLLG